MDFPVDYSARDFWSFRRALLDFAAERYPDWDDRQYEADLGVMLVEVMSALSDEFAYYQDRIAREAFLETATQRRSIRRHARLVDYILHDGLAASTWLDVTVNEGKAGTLPSGMAVWAESDASRRVYYEVGYGLKDLDREGHINANRRNFSVNDKRNCFKPYIWDEDDFCLPIGSTSLYVAGAIKSDLLPFDDLSNPSRPGKWVLLRSRPMSEGIPKRTWMVRLLESEIEEMTDPLLNCPITKLEWEEAQATPFELNLKDLEVRGNLMPATAGKTQESVYLIVGQDPDHYQPALPASALKALTRAVERQGPNGTTTYLFSLPGSEISPLVWLGVHTNESKPEIRIYEVTWDTTSEKWIRDLKGQWCWVPSFLGTISSQATDSHFTLEDGTWKRVVGYHRNGHEFIHQDYANGNGHTIRFGDGEFGRVPAPGKVFEVSYRLGNGRIGNVTSETLTKFVPDADDLISAITNPIAADGGYDAETEENVRQLAPDAYRNITFRAVTEADYAQAAERLPWVQRAGAAFPLDWQLAYRICHP